jgi:hypothetical protein
MEKHMLPVKSCASFYRYDRPTKSTVLEIPRQVRGFAGAALCKVAGDEVLKATDLRTTPPQQTATALTIDDIPDHHHRRFEQALVLFNRTFPEEEKIDRRHFIELLEEKKLGLVHPFNYHFLVACRGSRVLGVCTGNYLAVTNMGFIGYLAVDPEAKGARVGSRLRARLVAEFRRDAEAHLARDLAAVIGEVEPTNRWLDTLVRTRNVLPLDFPYCQPPLREGSPPVELVLYLQAMGPPVHRIRVAALRQLLFAIYRRVYRVKFPLREPAFRQMMKHLDGRHWVGRRRRVELQRDGVR